jgi:hypothetical protein
MILFVTYFFLHSAAISLRVEPLKQIYDESYHWLLITFLREKIVNRDFNLESQGYEYASLGAIDTRIDIGFHLIFAVLSIPLEHYSVGLIEQVYLLRALNTVMFIAALLVARQALIGFKLDPQVAGLALWSVTIFPTAAITASTINYDNLAMLIFALFFRTLSKIAASIPTVHLLKVSELALWGAMATLVKVNFGAAAVAFGVSALLIYPLQLLRHRPLGLKLSLTRAHWVDYSKFGAALFAVPYTMYRVLSLYQTYGSLNPTCNKTKPLDFCLENGPFRVYWEHLRDEPAEGTLGSFVRYFFDQWIFAYSRSAVWTEPPISELSARAYGLSTLFLMILLPVLALFVSGMIFRGSHRAALGLGVTLYMAILLSSNYATFLSLGILPAHQFRYLLMILPVIAAIVIAELIDQVGSRLSRRFNVVNIIYVPVIATSVLFSNIASFL